MPNVRATGQLRHHFWGEYHCTIVLCFPDESSARDALTVLGNPWKVGEKDPSVLFCFGDGTMLDTVRPILAQYGAEDSGEAIDSINRSIDVGPLFAIRIPVVPAEQTALFA